MSDVLKYFSVFLGLRMMLLNIFNYLSDGRVPLVDDLGPSEVTKLRKIAPTSAVGKIFIFFA